MSGSYEFVGGYPTAATVARASDEADVDRAVSAYRFFYPAVSFEATWRTNVACGVVANRAFPPLEGTSRQVVFTPNSNSAVLQRAGLEPQLDWSDRRCSRSSAGCCRRTCGCTASSWPPPSSGGTGAWWRTGAPGRDHQGGRRSWTTWSN